MEIFAKRALLAEDWGANVALRIEAGRIASVQPNARPGADALRVDTLLPAPGNLHSHTFQRAMAGMTERRASGQDSFWTWREVMYRFVARLTPEQVEAIAALAFVEMLEAGFASVGEFHYLHHAPDGSPYDDPAELSLRIFAAAERTGIGLTHLPVLYSYGGAGQAPLAPGQRRFGNDLEGYLTLCDGIAAGLAHLSADARMGHAPHSLRATAPDDLKALLAYRSPGPLHIHAAEQRREVREVAEWLGARPVEWLVAEAGVDADWCIVHATHMTDEETTRLARSGAVAGLCPVTEANLGDGIFPGARFLKDGGSFGLGTDSNVAISLVQEMRALEYSQRLSLEARNVLAPEDGGSTGERVFRAALAGGARALGRDAGVIEQGRLADLMAFDSTDPALCALSRDDLLDGAVFATARLPVTNLWSAGRHCVKGGRHVGRDRVVETYRRAIADLAAAL